MECTEGCDGWLNGRLKPRRRGCPQRKGDQRLFPHPGPPHCTCTPGHLGLLAVPERLLGPWKRAWVLGRRCMGAGI
jgi:hypothetical protein